MPDSARILLIDDESAIRRVLSKELQSLGLDVQTAENVAAARTVLAHSSFDAIVLDIRMPGMTGDQYLKELRIQLPEVPVIILTAHANVELAVQCMREGASDLVTKPCSVEHLHLTINRAMENQRLRDQAKTLTRIVRPSSSSRRIVGRSPSVARLMSMVERVAPTEEPVLIVGESGTGKELIAREIVEKSRRADKPFLTVNCAAVAETLLESELFGHERGAFSGAEERRLGFFELAHEGTVFLDEIGDMPLSMQPKLLRVLQSGEFRRVGGSRTLNADVRIIAATNKSLNDEVREGRFRQDLMHRVNTIVLESPPLRERTEDLEVLVQYFMRELDAGCTRSFSDDALASMRVYSWPGNIRELRNAVRRAMILSENETLEVGDLPPHLLSGDAAHSALPPANLNQTQLSLAEVEQRHIMAVLREVGGNKTAAARRLGIATKTLYNKLEAWQMPDLAVDMAAEGQG